MNNSPKVTSSDARIMLQEAYEHSYGIMNHDSNVFRPLALVAMSPLEDTVTNMGLSYRLKKFADYKVNKYFGISIIEFLELPTYVCDEIFDAALAKLKEDTKNGENILRELDDS